MIKFILAMAIIASAISKPALSDEHYKSTLPFALAVTIIGASIGAPAAPVFASYVVIEQMIIGGHEPAPSNKRHTRSGR